jgi:hypothetical protein
VRFGRTVSAFSILSQKRSEREVDTVFSPVSLLLLLRSTGPPRWRVSSVGERGANTDIAREPLYPEGIAPELIKKR